MRLGVIEVRHSVECRKCGREFSAGTETRMYARFAIHTWRAHEVTTLQLLAALWALAMGGVR